MGVKDKSWIRGRRKDHICGSTILLLEYACGVPPIQRACVFHIYGSTSWLQLLRPLGPSCRVQVVNTSVTGYWLVVLQLSFVALTTISLPCMSHSSEAKNTPHEIVRGGWLALKAPLKLQLHEGSRGLDARLIDTKSLHITTTQLPWYTTSCAEKNGQLQAQSVTLASHRSHQPLQLGSGRSDDKDSHHVGGTHGGTHERTHDPDQGAPGQGER
jgi:hypothetical protein